MTDRPPWNFWQMSCVDRCVGKFLAAQENTGTQINNFNQTMAQMQPAQMQQQQQQQQQQAAQQ